MLFGYPIDATTENWLHDCLIEAIKSVHAAADATQPMPGWPGILPEPYRAVLSRRSGLRDRLLAYDQAIRALSPADRVAVLTAVDDQNCIADLLSAQRHCASIDVLHAGVREPILDLFRFAFTLLSDLGIRDLHYKHIYDSTERVCPFCGAEYFAAPTAPREALDHYLAISRYPFAGANLRNLVPMGNDCNSKYKLAVDILHHPNGTRRVAIDPYSHTLIKVTLDDSKPFSSSQPNTPAWVVKFEPDTQAVATWEQVFSIRERYVRDHLDGYYGNWLKGFRSWSRSLNLRPTTDADLIDALRRHEEYHTDCGNIDRAFLKAAVFRMLRLHCQNRDARLLTLVRDLLAPIGQPSAA